MSWSIPESDLRGGRGAPLPNGIYRVLVEQATVENKETGTQIMRQYGNLRVPNGEATEFTLPDGSTYRIGNRKLFARSWWDQQNDTAQSIGRRELMREAIALGLVPKPAKGEDAMFPFDTPEAYATEIAGKELLVRTQLRARTGRDKKPVKDDEGNVVMEPQVVEWLAL